MHAISHSRGQVAVKIPYRGFEISLAFDDGTLTGAAYMGRSYLKVFKGDEDMTNRLFGKEEPCSLREWDIPHAYKMIDDFIESPW